MSAETERRYSDDQLRELAKLGPLSTVGDTEGIETVYENLGGEENVGRMRSHINRCLKCKERIQELAAG